MKVSVYITSYNQKEYLKEAIESVLGQTLKPDQVIIVDDCSTDGSQQLIAGFQSQYPELIMAIYHPQNTGVAQVRIDALNAITGDYVTYLDGDDRFLLTKLKKEASLLNAKPSADIAFSNNFYMTSDGVHIGTWVENEKPPEGSVFCQTFARNFPKRNLFRMELVNYTAWKQIGFHDPCLHLYEDFDMRIRLTKCLRVVYYDEPLSEIRQCGKGLSSSKFVRHFKALNYIYYKNKSLLNDLNEVERKNVTRKFGGWIAPIAKRASEEVLNEGHRLEAVRLLLAAKRYDPTSIEWSLLAKLLLPLRF